MNFAQQLTEMAAGATVQNLCRNKLPKIETNAASSTEPLKLSGGDGEYSRHLVGFEATTTDKKVCGVIDTIASHKSLKIKLLLRRAKKWGGRVYF